MKEAEPENGSASRALRPEEPRTAIAGQRGATGGEAKTFDLFPEQE